jgi:hypothetical protein
MNTQKYFLFLDDVRKPKDVSWVYIPKHPWTIVRNYNEFVDIIRKDGIPEYVCYDHDLSDEHYNNYHEINQLGQLGIDYNQFKSKTGYDCAKFLCDVCVEQKVKHPSYVVHSMNPVGKLNIESYINSYNRTIV